jgi:hypothetical protein
MAGTVEINTTLDGVIVKASSHVFANPGQGPREFGGVSAEQKVLSVIGPGCGLIRKPTLLHLTFGPRLWVEAWEVNIAIHADNSHHSVSWSTSSNYEQQKA